MSSAIPEEGHCSKCGKRLGGLGLAGVCPLCLLETALKDPELEPAESESAPGSTLPFNLGKVGDYELLEEIARGGMGVVYKARQISLDRVVALKMLLFGRYAGSEFVHRFRIEAAAAASLQHPNIVAIHEVGVFQDQHYLVMDLVDGPNLAQLVRDHPLPPKRAARYVKTIAEAIEFAHSRRILHRDLKPSNVLIDSNDQPRITDFGLAKRLAPGSDSSMQHESLTLTGQVLGSPHYIPPEQASGARGKIGPASDIYSIGAILYHTLTARPPFLGETIADTLQQVLHAEPIPPRLLNPSIPVDLETICLKCLEKEPERRFAGARELADELGRFLRSEPIRARPVTRMERVWRWSRRKPMAAALVAAVVLLLSVLGIGGPIVAYRIDQARLDERRNLYTADVAKAHHLIEEGDFGRARDLLNHYLPSSDGPDLRGFEWYFLSRQLKGDDLKPEIEPGTPPSRHLCLSRDGRLIAAGNQLWDTRSRQTFLDLRPDGYALGFSADGSAVILNRGPDLAWRSLETGEETVLLREEPAIALVVSPGGGWIVAGTQRGLRLFETQTLRLVNSSTNAPFDQWPIMAPHASAFNFTTATGLAFSPDDQRLLVISGYALAHRSELSCWSIPSLDRIAVPMNAAFEDATCAVFTEDGREFVTAHWDGDIRWWDSERFREISSRRMRDAHRTHIMDMAWLPNSPKLVTIGADRCIRIWDTETGGPPVVLRGHSGEIWRVAVSPDGKMLYTAGRDHPLRQWLAVPPVPDDGPISRFGAPLLPAGISSDGRLLATVSEKALHVWRIGDERITEETALRTDLSGLGKLPVNARKWEGDAVASPDLNWLAVSRPKRSIIKLISLRGEHPVRELDVGADAGGDLAFSSDSRLLAAGLRTSAIKVFDLRMSQEIATVPPPGEPNAVYSCAFAARRNILAIVGTRSVLLWDASTRQALREVPAHGQAGLISFAISPDARKVAMGYNDDFITLHESKTGRLIDRIQCHVSGVERLCFSPDGRTIASASGRWVRLWDIRTLREKFSLEHGSMVIFMEFTPDGNALVTAEMSGVTRVWRAAPSPSAAPAGGRESVRDQHDAGELN